MNDAINDLLNVYAYWWASGAADPADREREEESCRLAEAALEKQKQRVPDSEISEIGGIQHTCPSCWGFVGYLHDYCENCGQKLNWED